jgi:hypothetical protein
VTIRPLQCSSASAPSGYRLVVDLVRSEHIVRLGPVALPEPIAVRERIRFWRELEERFRDLAARLANRVSAEDRRKALAAIHARIPKPTEANEQAARIDVARDDVAFWGKVRDGEGADAAINKTRGRLIEAAQKQLADSVALKEMAERQIAAAQARFVKLTRGERAAGNNDPSAREAAALFARAAHGPGES